MKVFIQSMYEKLEPYEPCPIHPQNKFKFCCYRTAREASKTQNSSMSITNGQMNAMLRKRWQDTDYKYCFGEGISPCSGPLIRAHSIQNNRILDRICVDNHVYRLEPIVENDFAVKLKKIGRNQASTFFGFCNDHDTKIFLPIEVKDYACTSQQDFLFAFRALTLETHMKKRQMDNVINIFKEFPNKLLDPFFVRMYRVALSDYRDYENDFELLESSYIKNDFGLFNTFFHQLDYEVPFATCATFAIQHDLDGKEINEIHNIDPSVKIAPVFVNIYPILGRSNIIISHLARDNHIYTDYFNQLRSLKTEQLVRYLNALLVHSTENIFFSPKLIDSMTSEARSALERSFLVSTHPDVGLELLVQGDLFNFDLFQPVLGPPL